MRLHLTNAVQVISPRLREIPYGDYLNYGRPLPPVSVNHQIFRSDGHAYADNHTKFFSGSSRHSVGPGKHC
jgi:hypothetical protein